MSQPAIPAVENVTGPRIVAGIIDVVVLIVFSFIFSAIFGDADAEGSSASFQLSGLPFILLVLASIAYYLVPEAMYGQTLGKKIMGLKVVAESGELSWGKVAIRTVLRIIDGFFFYLVAVILIAVSKKHQRLGDMAAGTLVVKA
jgi:uncharacterized RDD family membrane protein YckC